MPTFYEFFAGGGMAREGLGPTWKCLLANEIDSKKASTYTANWGEGEPKACNELIERDVAKLKVSDIPAPADLSWASFPCQDLSLAGGYAGLKGGRSGTFWPFWQLMKGLKRQGKAPFLIVLENVCGALTSHGGEDFAQLGKAITDAGYRFGAVVIDAAAFLPQSRPRLFIIDALSSYLGDGTQGNSQNDIRAIIDPVSEWASENRIAVLGIMHPPKGKQDKAIHLVGGSFAFAAAARIVLGIMRDPDNAERRLMVPIKCNIGQEPLCRGR